MNTCIQCAFAKFMPGNVTTKTCHGHPPTPMILPERGGASINMMRPVVKNDDLACSLFKGRADSEPIGKKQTTYKPDDGTAAPSEPGQDSPTTR